MFFDRAMYASPSAQFPSLPQLTLTGSQWETCVLSLSTAQTNLTPTDPLPNRPHNHNRTAKDPPLLRAAPKAQGHCSLLRRTGPDPDAVGAGGLPGRAVRDLHPVRGLPGHHCGVCKEYTSCWAVCWDAD